MSVVDKLTKQHIIDFRECFSLFVADQEGTIKAEDLGQVLRALGQFPTNSELDDIVNECDVDGNGTLEFAEFVILMTSKYRETTLEEELVEAFDVLDRAKDKHISSKDLKYYMRKVARVQLSSEEAEAMIEYADSDDDGLVTYPDFRKKLLEALASDEMKRDEESENSDKDSDDD